MKSMDLIIQAEFNGRALYLPLLVADFLKKSYIWVSIIYLVIKNQILFIVLRTR